MSYEVTATPQPLSLTIATRESRLALWQANHVKQLLEAKGHRVTLMGMTTKGDQILDRSLSKVGGKGLFVKELEVALAQGEAHLAVHSLKDVPMDLPEGFELACVMEREDPRDAWVSNHCATWAELPTNGVIGTSSLRREVLLKAALKRMGRQDVRIEPLRGNLDTRLRKLDEGQYDAIVLAAAGLKRMEMHHRIRAVFAESEMLPAAGQGALGIEIVAGADAVRAALHHLIDMSTWMRVEAERAVSRTLGGSCSVPLAAHAHWVDASARLLQVSAAWGDVSGSKALIQATATAVVSELADANALGCEVARELLAQGAEIHRA